jgi:hypothetical protein
MSVLSAHIGSKQVTFLISGVSLGYETFTFPFVYNPVLHSHFVDEKTFYTDIFKHVMKKYSLSLDDCDIYICSEYRPVELDVEIKASTTVFELLSEVSDVNVIYANSIPLVPMSRMTKPDMISFVSNLALVPGMLLEKTRHRMYKEFIYSCSSDGYKVSDPKLPFLFCGDKFSRAYENYVDIYQSVLSSLATFGVFNVAVDTQGTYLPMLLLKRYQRDLYDTLSAEIYPEVLGTVLRSDKAVECLFKTDLGTSQFFEVIEGTLFFVPCEENSQSFVSAKSPSIGQFEGFIKGGKLGFVVDARPVSNGILESGAEEENIVFFENFRKQIEEASKRL